MIKGKDRIKYKLSDLGVSQDYEDYIYKNKTLEIDTVIEAQNFNSPEEILNIYDHI